jgi:glutamate synthase (NADPH/NADH) large chain
MDRQRWLQGTLYHPDFEQDSCGFGLITQLDDKPSHWLVETAISSLAKLTHRGAVAADGKSGDGCGLLFRKPDGFLREVAAEADIALKAVYAAGLVFHHPDSEIGARSLRRLKEFLEAQQLEVPVSAWCRLMSAPVAKPHWPACLPFPGIRKLSFRYG